MIKSIFSRKYAKLTTEVQELRQCLEITKEGTEDWGGEALDNKNLPVSMKDLNVQI